MAEMYAEEDVPQVDSDVLPDDVEAEKSTIKLFQFLADDENLVDKLDATTLGATGVSSQTIESLDRAKRSMSGWLKNYERALMLAKLEPETAKKTFPFSGASTVMMPFISQAMLDFHARTVPELVWANEVVSIKTYGTPTPEKEARAVRVSDFMNYQISEEIGYWRAEQDKMLLALPCVGTAYKESYFNGDKKECRSDLLLANRVIFDHNFSTFEEAPDRFVEEEYTRNEVLTYIRGDDAWKLDEDTLPLQQDHPDPFRFVRAFTWIDMDDDGLTEPYQVIIYRETEAVVAVYPAYDEEEITTNEDGEIVNVDMVKNFTQYRFLPDPEGGPMGMGWGILLGDMFTAINTTVRQLIDAGTLANLAGNSGLIDAQLSGQGRGNRQQSGPIEVRMGELTPITTGSKSLGQSVVQFPYQGPNGTLFELTNFLLENVRQMTNSAMNMDTNSQEAAMMYLARLQQGLKVPNSIVMRVYDAAKSEFEKIARLNFRHYSDAKYNMVIDAPEEASMHADFNPEDCDIRLAVDPSQGSDIERQQRAQIIMDEAKADEGGILNKREVVVQWLEAMKVPDVERLAPPPDPNAKDPMQELMLANMAREADLSERDMNLREATGELKRWETIMKAMKEGAQYGLEFDKTEAEIALKYAEAFKNLWEIGMAGDDPVETIQNIESRLIDKEVAPLPPPPLDSPDPNPQPQGAAPMGPTQ